MQELPFINTFGHKQVGPWEVQEVTLDFLYPKVTFSPSQEGWELLMRRSFLLGSEPKKRNLRQAPTVAAKLLVHLSFDSSRQVTVLSFPHLLRQATLCFEEDRTSFLS